MFFLLLALLFIVPLVLIKKTEKIATNKKTDLFNEKLLPFNSVSKVVHFLDYCNQVKKNSHFDTMAYVNSASSFIKQRFSFGLANYSYSDNWIASLSADLFWDHFSAIVNPNDILKHHVGICSQQTIVFLEILKQKKINVRTVCLGNQIKGPGHFICEANYNGTWHVYDVTKEPNWDDIEDKHFSMEYYLTHQNLFYKVYENKIAPNLINKFLNEVAYGKPNEFPAKNMLFFHKVTYWSVILLPFIFALLALVYYRKSKIKF